MCLVICFSKIRHRKKQFSSSVHSVLLPQPFNHLAAFQGTILTIGKSQSCQTSLYSVSAPQHAHLDDRSVPFGCLGGFTGSDTRPESLNHLRLLPSPNQGHPCPHFNSTVVTILGLAVEEDLLASAATELARLQPALDSKHVDSLVNAVTQKGGPQMIHDLIDVRRAFQGFSCCGLSDDSGEAFLRSAACRLLQHRELQHSAQAHLNAGRLDEAPKLTMETFSRR